MCSFAQGLLINGERFLFKENHCYICGDVNSLYHMMASCPIFEKERNDLIIKIKNSDFTLPIILDSTEYVILNAMIVYIRKIVKNLEKM